MKHCTLIWMQVGASGAEDEAAISEARRSRVRAAVASLGWVRVYGAHSHQINPNWAGVTVLWSSLRQIHLIKFLSETQLEGD